MELPQIPVLNYHKIELNNDIGITSRHPADFRRDMEYLAQNSYHSITFKDIKTCNDLPENPVIITFDDGYASVYEQAYPVLTEFDFNAVVFIPSAYIGGYNDWDVQFGSQKYRHLSKQQIIELHKNGFEIAAHGKRHIPFTALDTNQLKSELCESKYTLEKIIGSPVITLCYPFGQFNRRVIERVREAGYQYAMASLYIGKQPEEYFPLALRRFNVYRFDSSKKIAQKLKSDYHSLLAYRDWLFQLGGKITPLYQRLFNDRGKL